MAPELEERFTIRARDRSEGADSGAGVLADVLWGATERQYVVDVIEICNHEPGEPLDMDALLAALKRKAAPDGTGT